MGDDSLALSSCSVEGWLQLSKNRAQRGAMGQTDSEESLSSVLLDRNV